MPIRFYEPIVCADGFEISIQAHTGVYCAPRNNEGPYTHVECGFPSESEGLIMPYIDAIDESIDPTDTVYGYVPAATVIEMLRRHGGIEIGECPLLRRAPKDGGQVVDPRVLSCEWGGVSMWHGSRTP